MLLRWEDIHIHSIEVLSSPRDYTRNSLHACHWHVEFRLHPSWALHRLPHIPRGDRTGVVVPHNGGQRSPTWSGLGPGHQESQFLWRRDWWTPVDDTGLTRQAQDPWHKTPTECDALLESALPRFHRALPGLGPANPHHPLWGASTWLDYRGTPSKGTSPSQENARTWWKSKTIRK